MVICSPFMLTTRTTKLFGEILWIKRLCCWPNCWPELFTKQVRRSLVFNDKKVKRKCKWMRKRLNGLNRIVSASCSIMTPAMIGTGAIMMINWLLDCWFFG